MISCNKGEFKLTGSLTDIEADLALIVHGTKMALAKKLGDYAADVVIRETVDAGLMSEEELHEKIIEMFGQMMEGEEEDE